MSEKPTPTPEGKLIQAAIKRAGISARQAADRAGLSEGRWRQIANGYQVVSKGVYIPVEGPPETVAAMARVAGIAPDELDEVGREDAATALREMQPGLDASPLAASEWDGELIGEAPLLEDEELRWRDGRGRLFQYRVAGFEHEATMEPGAPPGEAILVLRSQMAKRIHQVTGLMMDRPQKAPNGA